MSHRRKERGNEAENLARLYLEQHGLVCLERNVRTRWGEIDLVMCDGNAIAFVEVRFRQNHKFGHPAETVDGQKQGKIRRAAKCLLGQGKYDNRPLRFDVVAISRVNGELVIEWNKNAFE